MEPESGADTYFRFVEGPAYLGYRPFACFGWNAAELIVKDIDQLATLLHGSPFHAVDPPANPSSSEALRALRVVGPSGEVLSLTELAPGRRSSNTAEAARAVGRLFGVILGGASLEALHDYYHRQHGLDRAAGGSTLLTAPPIGHGLSADQPQATSTLPLSGTCRIEAQQMAAAATARPCEPGQLPPALAMVSVEVDHLPETLPGALGEIHRPRGLPYAGRRSRTCVGPAGELIELIELIEVA